MNQRHGGVGDRTACDYYVPVRRREDLVTGFGLTGALSLLYGRESYIHCISPDVARRQHEDPSDNVRVRRQWYSSTFSKIQDFIQNPPGPLDLLLG